MRGPIICSHVVVEIRFDIRQCFRHPLAASISEHFTYGNLAGEPLGRIKMRLHADVVPKTAENFRRFCTGETKNVLGRPQGYKGCRFHRVVSFWFRRAIRHPLISIRYGAKATRLTGST